MVPLCRHIMPSNKRCDSPAVHGQLYCYHHKVVKIATYRPPRKKYDCTYIIPFHFAEDRAAIQLNLHLINRALMEGRIDTRTANAYNNNQRIALSNLRLGPLAETDSDNAIRRVILTPEGDEIATPHEKLEKDESPIHYKDCPCQSCAEQYRGATPEQHHADCQCGLCEETSDQRSALSDQNEAQPSTDGCHPERSEGPASSDPATVMGAPSLEPPATKVGNHESWPSDKQASATKRGASAHALRSADTLSPIQKTPNYHNYLHGDEIAKHEAQHAARARAALEAGLDLGALHLEEMWDGAKRGCLDGQSHPDQPKEFKPFLTWGEEHDLKLAEMKRLREQDEARLREQSLNAS